LEESDPESLPLYGLPVAVKDLVPVADMPCTQGSLLYRDMLPAADAPLIARLRAKGAVFLGKTNTPEFGFGAHCLNRLAGPTATPHDLAYSSGGSSGGSAAAVAAGLAAAAIGTDYGGSVRTPAAFCGVVGFRPTPGRFAAPDRALAWDAGPTIGLLTRSVRDAALLFGHLSTSDPADPLSMRVWPEQKMPAKPRLAASADLGVAPVAKAVRLDFASALAALGPAEMAAPDCSGAMEAFGILRAAHIHHALAPLREAHREKLTETVLWNIARGDGLSAERYLQAEAIRSLLHRRFLEFFRHFDFLLLPSAAVPPFRHGSGEVLEIDGRPLATPIDYLAITFIITLAGCPALSLPYWSPGATLPFGLQIVAAPGEDLALLDFAEKLEALPGFGFRPPPGFAGMIP